MNRSVIGIVCDFDETLGPDTIGYLLTSNKLSEDKFWQEVYAMIKEGFDPPLAYMQHLLTYTKDGKIDLSQKALNKLGKNLPLFPGLPESFVDLKEYVKKEPMLKKIKVDLEFYIISGGLEDVILGTPLVKNITGIFGSSFAYDKKGKVVAVKTAISFTEKTRFLFGINKGLSVSDLRTDPYKINKIVDSKERRVPFSQMIYIGDGPSDVPCLSTVSQHGGIGIGVSSPHKTFANGVKLARGKRLTVGPYTANFKKGSDMRKVLEETILSIGLEIDINRKKRQTSSPVW